MYNGRPHTFLFFLFLFFSFFLSIASCRVRKRCVSSSRAKGTGATRRKKSGREKKTKRKEKFGGSDPKFTYVLCNTRSRNCDGTTSARLECPALYYLGAPTTVEKRRTQLLAASLGHTGGLPSRRVIGNATGQST